MSIITLYYLHCTDCGKEYKEAFDDKESLMKYAHQDGWVSEKVPNGSMWDFCITTNVQELLSQLRNEKINKILNNEIQRK